MMKFPPDFLLGFSESGFQFEMGFPDQTDPNTDWWIWVHDPDNIASGIVSGHLPEEGPGYLTLYKIDHEIAERLGANTLRLGVEWSRIFPKSTKQVPVAVERDEEGVITRVEMNENTLNLLRELANKKAIETYRYLLKDWVSRGKKLILNLNHFTLPSWLHNPVELRLRGVTSAPSGWLSEDSIIEFAKYAYLVAREFSDLVDMWSTLNEPNVVATAGYLNVKSGFPPGLASMEYTMVALRNQIIAHARAYDTLKEVTKKPVGVIHNFMCFEPLNPENSDDVSAAFNASLLYNHLFIDSVTQGSSMLVSSDSLRNRLDWIGVNYYTRMVVTSDKKLMTGWRYVPGYGFLCTPDELSKAGKPCSDFGWETYPEGLEKVLLEVYERYKLPIIVTENGIADSADKYRSSYILTHLLSVLRALEKGIDVRGYLHWALIDNYEWAMGFNMRFGLVKVAFSTKKRYLRPSALFFKEIATRHEIPEDILFV